MQLGPPPTMKLGDVEPGRAPGAILALLRFADKNFAKDVRSWLLAGAFDHDDVSGFHGAPSFRQANPHAFCAAG